MDREHEHHQNMPYYLLKKKRKRKKTDEQTRLRYFGICLVEKCASPLYCDCSYLTEFQCTKSFTVWCNFMIGTIKYFIAILFQVCGFFGRVTRYPVLIRTV